MGSRVLAFLRDEGNRAVLGWIGGGLVVLAGGFWAVFTFYVDHSMPPPPPATAIVEQKGTGIALHLTKVSFDRHGGVSQLSPC